MRGALRRFWRSIKTDPWYGVSVVVTIGLGIGISTSAFTVLDRLVLRSPPGVRNPQDLRRILVTEPASPAQPRTVERNSFSYPELRVILQATSGQGEVTSYWTWPDKIPIRLNTEVLSARVLGVSTNYFEVLGVNPVLGRMFSAASAMAAPGGGPAEVVVGGARDVRRDLREYDLRPAEKTSGTRHPAGARCQTGAVDARCGEDRAALERVRAADRYGGGVLAGDGGAGAAVQYDAVGFGIPGVIGHNGSGNRQSGGLARSTSRGGERSSVLA